MSGGGRPAVFVDRDGTLIHDRRYLADPEGVELLPGAGEGVARLNAAGLAVVLVTNQSGIGRGYFDEARYREVHARLVDHLARMGAVLDGAYHAPGVDEPGDPDADRKPGAGLFRRAARELSLDLGRSWLVGDRMRDVIPAGILGARGLLVRGHPSEERATGVSWLAEVGSFEEAVDRILEGIPQW
jgi:D-glycero-D-manno-heptose 1,7-bisphosphate phosphatase